MNNPDRKTIDRYNEIFDLVKCPDDYKMPIDFTFTEKEWNERNLNNAVVTEAIEWYTASAPTFHTSFDPHEGRSFGAVRVTAPGYYIATGEG